ncbi:MAG: 50S ribosomal protein L18 [Oscillospiraceae bacterium]|jgi:large subunit ribosomal protein L18|nr:50S ribosomal protein L18 [Oscillospiraceae bacterium]
MIAKRDSNKQRLRRHKRVRGKVSGTAERPRLSVFRSLQHIYAQLIDDVKGVTLASASSAEKDFDGYGGNAEAAKKVGKLLGARAAALGVTEVVFDRGGYVYHGRVQQLAEGAREGGLRF